MLESVYHEIQNGLSRWCSIMVKYVYGTYILVSAGRRGRVRTALIGNTR